MRPNLVPRPVLLGLVAALLLCAAHAQPPCARTDAACWTRLATQYANTFRAENNRGPLVEGPQAQLDNAVSWAQELIRRNDLVHQDLQNLAPICGRRINGENIAYVFANGDANFDVARDCMDGWIGSTGHRENLLRESFRVVSVGVAFVSLTPGSNERIYCVQTFSASLDGDTGGTCGPISAATQAVAPEPAATTPVQVQAPAQLPDPPATVAEPAPLPAPLPVPVPTALPVPAPVPAAIPAFPAPVPAVPAPFPAAVPAAVPDQQPLTLLPPPRPRFPRNRFPRNRFPRNRFPRNRFPRRRVPRGRFPRRVPRGRFPRRRVPRRRVPRNRVPRNAQRRASNACTCVLRGARCGGALARATGGVCRARAAAQPASCAQLCCAFARAQPGRVRSARVRGLCGI